MIGGMEPVGADSSQFSPSEIAHLIDSRGFPTMKPAVLDDVDAPEGTVTLTLPLDEYHADHPGRRGDRHRIVCRQPIGSGGYTYVTRGLFKGKM